jgi:site-specific recombinase XerD
MTALPVRASADVPIALVDLGDVANEYARRSRAEATVKAYRSDWRAFVAWCDQHAATALPAAPTTVAAYLADHAGTLKAATLRRRLTSIGVAHGAAGHRDPADDARVKAVWAGVRRTHGTAQHPKEAAVTSDIKAMVASLPDSALGRRDACLLLIGFATGMRRSELVALDVDDVADTPDGLLVTITRSKTDQAGEGRQVGVPYGSNPITCPVRAWRAWLATAAIDSGPLFRPIDRFGRIADARLSAQAVALIVKRAAAAAGLDPARYAGHSLRSGMATSAARAGATELEIMNQTGHRSLPVLRRYIRRGSLFTDNAAAKLGL